MIAKRIKSFNTIVKTFRKTVDDLNTLEQDKELKMLDIESKIIDLNGEHQDHLKERDQAKTLKSNLLKLLGE